jgi:acetyl esterase/lipase
MKLVRYALVLAVAGSSAAFAQQAGTRTGPKVDSSVIDAQGTAHVTRVVPLPEDLSPQARAMVGKQVSDAPNNQTLAERRSRTDAWQARAGEAMKAVYPAKLVKAEIAGVPVRIVTPLEIPAANRDRVMLNVHGGGFNSDSGSLVESIPMANLTKTKVVSVLYRLAPEHPFPAAVDDTVAVYKELLKTYPAKHIGLYGTSAGAILTAEVAVKLHQLGLPLPGALGVFSGFGDFSRMGDTWSIYTLDGLSGHLDPPDSKHVHDAAYIGSTDPRDPVLSPLFADVHGFPPTLFISATRDALLSGTTILQRHFFESGVEAPMVVFEGLPHAFWYNVSLPESREAMGVMAKFLDAKVEK